MKDSTTTSSVSNCLGRTCLQWRADGELSAGDLALVIQRLRLVDREVVDLQHSTWDQMPSSPFR